MSAYGNIDSKMAGLKQGFDSRVESKRAYETDGLLYGYPAFGYEGNDKDAFLYHNNRAQIVWDADFVTGNSIVVTVDGTAVTAVPFNSTQAQTITDLVAQIEADITGASAEATDVSGDNRTITITIEDDDDRVVTEAVTGGASQASGTITYDSTQIFLGMVLLTQKESAQKVDADGNVLEAAVDYYEQKDAANVMIDGWITAVTGAAVSSGKAAYVVATGTHQGKVTDVSTDNVALTGVTIEETVAAAGLAIVRVNK